MTQSPFKALSLLSLSLALFQIASPAAAQTASGYLNWPGKSGASSVATKEVVAPIAIVAQPLSPQTPQNDVIKTQLPPKTSSKALTLNQSANYATVPQPSLVPGQTNPIIGVSESYVYRPTAMSTPAKTAPVKKAEPSHKETWPKSAQSLTPKPLASKAIKTPSPTESIARTPAATQKPLAPLQTGAYQVPSNSKYAAKLAQIHNQPAQTEVMSPISDKPHLNPTAKTSPSTKLEKATTLKPQPATQPTPLAEVIPAKQAPRVYSLHRQYGLTPDTISVSTTENGALLVTDLNLGVSTADDKKAGLQAQSVIP